MIRRPLVGWNQIAKFLGISTRSAKSYRQELVGREVISLEVDPGGHHMLTYEDALEEWARSKGGFTLQPVS